MMFQIPIIAVAFHLLNSFALKMIVDSHSANKLITPIVILIGIAVLQELICRSRQWAFNKSQPFIRGEIVSRAYDHVQSNSYKFFQNTQSGSLVSKIKVIVAGYDDLFEYIWYRITNPLFMVVFGVLSLFFINSSLGFLVLICAFIYFTVMVKMSIRLGKLSQKSNDLKHQLLAMIADNISNIFTIFSFASKQRELAKIKKFACGEVVEIDYQKVFIILSLPLWGLYYSVLCFLLFYFMHFFKVKKYDYNW